MKKFIILLIILLFISLDFSYGQGSLPNNSFNAIESRFHHQQFPGQCVQFPRNNESSSVCVHFSPSDMPYYAVENYLAQAKKKIQIASYNLSLFSEILERKLKEGVMVEIMMDFRLSYSDDEKKPWNTLKSHPLLTKYRLPVLRGRNPQMHNKMILIDDRQVIFGSANFTYSGLLANYENVMMIEDPSVVKKFNEEYEELKEMAKITCQYFAEGECDQGGKNWNPYMKSFLIEGSFPASIIKKEENESAPSPSECQKLTNDFGLLNEGNQSKMKNMNHCFDLTAIESDKFLAQFSQMDEYLTKISSNERYVDGTLVKDSPQFFRHYSKQTEKIKVYFSPEDNLINQITYYLKSTLKNPTDSFVYVSVNFITHPKISEILVQLKEAGVRLRVFFDKGRYDDENYHQALEELKKLGLSFGSVELTNDSLSIFNNTITSSFGCNHNKFAIVGNGKKLWVLNGSANWSKSAMRFNDENLVVIEDEQVASIFLKEMISQLYIYRYGQLEQSPGFQDELTFFEQKVPCLKTLLGMNESCSLKADGVDDHESLWKPHLKSSAILSLHAPDIDPTKEDVWVWVPQLKMNQGGALKLHTATYFDQKWVTPVPMPLGWKMTFKFFKTPKNYDVTTYGIHSDQVTWEYGGIGNDRELQVSPLALEVIRDQYRWGIR